MKTKLCTKYINAVSIDMVLKFLCDCDLQHIVAVGFLSHWAYFTVLRFIFVYVLSLYIV